MTTATGVLPLDQSCTDLIAATITFVESKSLLVATRTVVSLLINEKETAMLFSPKWNKQKLRRVPVPGGIGGLGGGYSLIEAIYIGKVEPRYNEPAI